MGKINFRSYEERKKAGEKLCREGEQLKILFERISPVEDKDNSKFESVPALAEVIKMEDTMLISLEISIVAEAYKAIENDQKRNKKTVFSWI
ncbi:Exocyst complex component 3 [Holothuria leucospilota]|uniref:Exocyst complex component 3 n=1 Tax=Holothuria leucospilota TaxID=206669 RepID=A0A9Q0YE98_HOLLE|nr:Exocyst complex component 3 [Holothuria leucospilota]